MSICYSCRSNSGEKRISPGIQIFNGKYWLVEHAYPTGLLGWLVVVLKRHCEELHNLRKEEMLELAEIQYYSIQSLNKLYNPKKEYCSCFAEMDGFKHIHYHIIPKTKEFLDENNGTKAFNYLKVVEEDRIKDRDIVISCEQLNECFIKLMGE